MSQTPSMDACDHPDGGYAFAPGIPPYSAGARARPGFVIRRVALRQPVPWRQGLTLVDQELASSQRPPRALCSIELRCPEPHTFDGFEAFNHGYRQELDRRGILLDQGVNPVARTNVAPATDPPAETELFAFGYTVPTVATDHDPRSGPTGGHGRPSFIISGAGDLRRQADLQPAGVIGGDRPWSDTAPERAQAVLDVITSRLTSLGVTWADTDTIDAYTVEDLHLVTGPVLLPGMGAARDRGVHWYLAHPPITGLRFEMDARGGVEERWW